MTPFEKIKTLKDEEIDEYINHRLSLLKNKEQKEIGLNTDQTIVNELLDENIIVNISADSKEAGEFAYVYFASLVFDDDEMYKYLIRAVRNADNPYDAVINASDEYLNMNDPRREDGNMTTFMRDTFYKYFSLGPQKPLSIKTFHKHYFAICSEVAGVVHNMFKFLGIDSDYIIGNINGNSHAFNIVYYFGRDKKAIMVDASRCYKQLPTMVLLGDEEKQSLLPYGQITIDDNDVKKAYMEMFGMKIDCDKFEDSYAIYDELFFEAEDGVEVSSDIPRTLKFKLVNKEVK